MISLLTPITHYKGSSMPILSEYWALINDFEKEQTDRDLAC